MSRTRSNGCELSTRLVPSRIPRKWSTPSSPLLLTTLRILTLLTLLLIPALLPAQQPSLQPPVDVKASDHPDDAGDAIDLSWTPSPHDHPATEIATPRVSRYEIERRSVRNGGDFTKVAEVPAATKTYTDNFPADRPKDDRKQSFEYRVVAVGSDGQRAVSQASNPAAAKKQYFRGDRAWLAIFLLLICGAFLWFITRARQGKQYFVRPIAGLNAINEAVGRATEMGRPCLFIPGIQDLNEIQTVAGLTVLNRVATVIAEYGAQLEVPTARSLVMTAARETVQSAFLAAGRPDAFRPDDIYYISDEQFGYVVAVTGKMVREKPAACFYMGQFFAESLVFAETGNSIGSIQIAGTAETAQLPFFIVACDYALIGEEFFAASAYLSREPFQLGTLRGQDFAKLLGALLILFGCLLATIVTVTRANPQSAISSASDYFVNHLLGKDGLSRKSSP